MICSANLFAEVILRALMVCSAAIYREKRATHITASNSGLTDSIRNQILNYHNAARLRVVANRCTRFDDSYISRLWSETNNVRKKLSRAPACYRVARGIEPNYVGCLNPAKICTNWYTSTGLFRDLATQINSALNTWWGAVGSMGLPIRGTDTRKMVFPETTKIGCAYKICPGATNTITITCLYNGIGYFTNQQMWETGSPCVSGADCTTYADSGCSGGLCIKEADVPGLLQLKY